jgi:DNA-binding transcriptional regulator GbsR (MarR family)
MMMKMMKMMNTCGLTGVCHKLKRKARQKHYFVAFCAAFQRLRTWAKKRQRHRSQRSCPKHKDERDRCELNRERDDHEEKLRVSERSEEVSQALSIFGVFMLSETRPRSSTARHCQELDLQV